MDTMDSSKKARVKMIETQLMARGITDERVLGVMSTIPRHLFVPPDMESSAYEDRPLQIGQNQTITLKMIAPAQNASHQAASRRSPAVKIKYCSS